jgi:hypothetical protein
MKKNMTQFIRISICLLLGLSSYAGAPCDPVREKQLEIKNADCSKRPLKSPKQWTSAATARFKVLKALRSGDADSLLPYLGCDSGFSTKLENICEPELPEIGAKELSRVSQILRKTDASKVERGVWLNYGANKDIWVFCVEGFKNSAARNVCDEKGKAQPVVEIRKDGNGYYLFGLPMIGD